MDENRFEIDGVWYVSAPELTGGEELCEGCAFNHSVGCCNSPGCSPLTRTDDKFVIFVREG